MHSASVVIENLESPYILDCAVDVEAVFASHTSCGARQVAGYTRISRSAIQITNFQPPLRWVLIHFRTQLGRQVCHGVFRAAAHPEICQALQADCWTEAETEWDADTYVATSFEPRGAHRAFPCVEGVKAEFELIFTQVADYLRVLSFAEENRTSTGRKFVCPRPVAPSSIGWVIGPFEKVEGMGIDVAFLQGYEKRASLVLEIAERVLQRVAGFFAAVELPGRLQVVLLPQHRGLGMENFMCITLFAGLQDETILTRLLAHEMVHMWIGNICTSKTQDAHWIKEGIARLLEFDCARQMLPEKTCELERVWTEDVIGAAMVGETLSGTPAKLTTLEEVLYGKGAALVSMIRLFVGADNFRIGLNRLVSEFEYFDLNVILEIFPQVLELGSWLQTAGPVTLRVDLDDSHIILTHATDKKFPIELEVWTNGICSPAQRQVVCALDKITMVPLSNSAFFTVNARLGAYVLPVYSQAAARRVPAASLIQQAAVFRRVKSQF